jgi:N-acyl-D-amino-acid deacylase
MGYHARIVATIVAGWTLQNVCGQQFDLVIRNGRLVDGTGSPARVADLAVKDGRVAAIGAITGKGKQELDARDKVVAPGFIDVHSHADDIDEMPLAENFARMGVTTMVVGNCGSSVADVAELFRKVERGKVSINVATLIGHGTVRSEVMGGSFMRPPTAEELDKMKAQVAKAMKDGAVGLSTGLIYLPGTFAKLEEIIELAKVAATNGGIYASHIRDESAGIFDAINELIRVSREASIPAEISHIKLSRRNMWGRTAEVLALIEKARAEGLRITQDEYTYTASSTGINSLIPEAAREGGRVKFAERLKSADFKKSVVEQMKEKLRESQETDYAFAVIANYESDKKLNGLNIVEATQKLKGSATLDQQIDLIIEIETKGGAQGVFHSMSEEDLQKFLRHPNTMIASDSGVRKYREGMPHPRGYGNNARVLARYVRELGVLTLEDAVRRMTSLPAATFHLKDRGQLQTGFRADITVFDPATVKDNAEFKDPHHYATGITHVFVNGVAVVKDEQHTKARPGMALRRAD